MAGLSVVLKSPPPDEELQPLIETVLRTWEGKLGLLFVYRGVAHREPGMLVRIWTEAQDPELEIGLVYDDVARFRYVTASAPDKARRNLMWQQLMRDLDTVPLSQLLEAVRQNVADDPDSFMRLAVGLSGRFDRETLDIVQEGLRSPDRSVRLGAAEAAAMLHWPQLKDAVERALRQEPDVEIANVLTVAVELSDESPQ